MTYSSQATTSILPQSDSTGTSRHRLNRDWKGLIICLSIAFLLRAFLIWRNPQELVHDRDSYLGIARTIAQGAGYCTPDSNSPTAFRPPLYPVLLSILSQIASVPVVVASINLLFGLLMVLWTYEATKLLGCRRMALTAAFLVSIDPLIIVYSGQPMTEVTCAALISLLLLIGIRNQLVVQSRLSRCSSEHTSDPSGNDSQTPLEPSPSRFWLNELAFGGVFGLLVLCRPTFWPVAGIWLIGQIVKRFFTG
ncbi:MAG: hypothetical protein FJ267_07250, partial [Planctomycetes bacterium]|nr:hypothetical protein [Planctomycetota bacterium]